MNLRLITCLSTLLLSGCATAPRESDPPFPRDPTVSKAMNVLMAAGFVVDPAKGPIRDVAEANSPQAARARNTDAIDAGYAISNVRLPPPGVGIGWASAMSAMSLLLPGPYEPLAHTRFIVWMPRAEASSPQAAQQKLQILINSALDTALDAALARPFVAVPREMPANGLVKITGGPCASPGAECMYWPWVASLPRAGTAPAILGGEPAWVWTHPDRRSEVQAAMPPATARISADLRHPNKDWLPDAAVYEAMSRALPPWVFLYLAPGQVALGEGQGFLPFPVILNQGQPLYFLAPGA